MVKENSCFGQRHLFVGILFLQRQYCRFDPYCFLRIPFQLDNSSFGRSCTLACMKRCPRICFDCWCMFSILEQEIARFCMKYCTSFSERWSYFELFAGQKGETSVKRRKASGNCATLMFAESLNPTRKLIQLKSDLELRCSHQQTPLYLSVAWSSAMGTTEWICGSRWFTHNILT